MKPTRDYGALDRLAVVVPLDPYLSLKALTAYSGMSVRKLRELLDLPAHPLPCYRIGGKILVRRSEFDTWMRTHRRCGRSDLNGIVDELLSGLA